MPPRRSSRRSKRRSRQSRSRRVQNTQTDARRLKYRSSGYTFELRNGEVVDVFTNTILFNTNGNRITFKDGVTSEQKQDFFQTCVNGNRLHSASEYKEQLSGTLISENQTIEIKRLDTALENARTNGILDLQTTFVNIQYENLSDLKFVKLTNIKCWDYQLMYLNHVADMETLKTVTVNCAPGNDSDIFVGWEEVQDSRKKMMLGPVEYEQYSMVRRDYAKTAKVLGMQDTMALLRDGVKTLQDSMNILDTYADPALLTITRDVYEPLRKKIDELSNTLSTHPGNVSQMRKHFSKPDVVPGRTR